MKKLLLVSLILIGMIVLTGCCCWMCDGFVTPSAQPQCSLTVVANSWAVYGWIVIDGNPTGEYIYPYQSITIYDLSCNQTVVVYIVDNCGYVSHKEFPFIGPGPNYVYFNYWDDQYKDGKKEQNDCHCKS